MSKQLDSTRLQHLEYAAGRLNKRLHDLTLDEFLADEDLQDIALRQFMVMGEAAAHVSEAVRQQHPQVDWRRITALRNFIAHEYFRVDYALIWETVVDLLPSLLAELPEVLQYVLAHEREKPNSGV